MDGISTLVLPIMYVAITILAGKIIKSYFDIFLVQKANTVSKDFLPWLPYLVWQFLILQYVHLSAYLHLIINIALILLICIYAYHGNLMKKLFFSASYVSLWMLMEFLVGYAFVTLDIDYTEYRISGAAISMLLLFICIKTLQLFFINKKINELPKKYNTTLLMIPLTSMFVMYTVFMISSRTKNPYDVICSFASLLIILAINIVIFNIYLKLSEELELRRCNTVFQQQLEMCDSHLREKELSMNAVMTAKHDMKQSYIYLLGLLEKQQYSKELCKNNMQLLHWKDCVIPLPTNLLFFDI